MQPLMKLKKAINKFSRLGYNEMPKFCKIVQFLEHIENYIYQQGIFGNFGMTFCIRLFSTNAFVANEL